MPLFLRKPLPLFQSASICEVFLFCCNDDGPKAIEHIAHRFMSSQISPPSPYFVFGVTANVASVLGLPFILSMASLHSVWSSGVAVVRYTKKQAFATTADFWIDRSGKISPYSDFIIGKSEWKCTYRLPFCVRRLSSSDRIYIYMV